MSKKIILKNLHGPIFSIITPFDNKENIDFKNLKKYINYLYKRGAKIFYIMTYNSRFGLLSESEVIKLNVFCIKLIKKLNKKNIVITGEPYHTSTSKSIEHLKIYEREGNDIHAIIFGEKYYSDNQLYDHFLKINKASKKSLLLHQQPLETGIKSKSENNFYSIKVLKKIFSLDKFIAMKEDAKNTNYTKLICKNLIPKKILIITSGRGKKQWLEAKKFGCQSWLSGISNLDPRIGIKFYDLITKKDYKKINFFINNIENDFFKLVDKYGWHLTIKSCLEHIKIFNRYERSPLQMISNKKHKDVGIKLKKIIKKTNSLFGEKLFQ